jgi:hypothetical protein
MLQEAAAVTNPDGILLRNAIVLLTDSQGVTRKVVTGSFGYYSFDKVTVGETYVIQVTSKRYVFAPGRYGR